MCRANVTAGTRSRQHAALGGRRFPARVDRVKEALPRVRGSAADVLEGQEDFNTPTVAHHS